MKIAILGWGSQGQSAYSYWQSPENEITICDSRTDLETPTGVNTAVGENYLADLDKFDLIVRAAPSIHPNMIAEANSHDILAKVTSNTNEFMNVCPTRNIIGVTGTKGKGTTSTLIARMLEAAGKTVHLGGNIGIPPLDLLKKGIKTDDWVILELANFQLIDLKSSPNIAVCLMVVPEHLNWHTDMSEYTAAKQQLFVWQTFDDVAIYYKGNEYSTTIAEAGNGTKVPYFAPPGAVVERVAGKGTTGASEGTISIGGQAICKTSELKLLGEHNWQNVCAAVTAVWQISHSVAALRSVLTTFAGLPHRLELVREVDGVRYYNDSFASTPDATVAALTAIPGKKVMIVGGFDRELPLEHLAEGLKANESTLRKVLLIGASAARLAKACDAAGFTNYDILTDVTMPEIVATATETARADTPKSDAVVLSPGFASFDMFKNFEDRGLQYKEAVNAL